MEKLKTNLYGKNILNLTININSKQIYMVKAYGIILSPWRILF